MIRFKEYCNVSSAISEEMAYHVINKIPLCENIFRVGSKRYFELFQEARNLYTTQAIELTDYDKALIEETDIGLFDEYEGDVVPLDCPMMEEENKEKIQIGVPKRGGPKKFFVYVKNPSTGKVKKVTFGDTTGLTVKMNNPEARKSFAARHQCSTQKDRTTAAYWACNLPRYAKQLGMSGGGNFYW